MTGTSKRKQTRQGAWQVVRLAAECPPCPCCGEEPWCEAHEQHFADCPCLGPTEDGVIYRMRAGVLYGKRTQPPE